MKETKLAAIDVGTTKVCTIMADTGGVAGLRILGVGITPSRGMHKGMVVDVDIARDAIRSSVRQAEQVAGYKLEAACIGITGRHISSTNSQGAIAITRRDQLVRPGDLKRVLEVAHSIGIPGEKKLLHVIPRTYRLDGQEGVKNPVGMHGARLDVEAHVITGAITSIQNLTKCIRSVGVDIEDLILEPLASSEAVLTPREKQDGVMLADIGGGTTDIAIFKDGNIHHTSVLPVAGYQVTRDISIGLGISFDLAEEMKRKYSNVAPVVKEGRPADTPLAHNGHSISYQDLSEIVRVRIEELLRLIVMELPQTNYAKLIPAGLVLTGGGANLPGITEIAQKIIRLPVRVGVPVRLEGVSDALLNPAHATGVGLLLWQTSKEERQDKQDWRTQESGLRRLVTRIFRLFR